MHIDNVPEIKWEDRAEFIATTGDPQPYTGYVIVTNIGIDGSLWKCENSELKCFDPIVLHTV